MERSDTANASRKAAFEKIIEDARVANTLFIPPLHLPIHRHRPLQSRSPPSSPPQQHQTVNDNSPAPPPPSSPPPENSLQLSPLPSPTSSVPHPESSLLSPPPPSPKLADHQEDSPPLLTLLTHRHDEATRSRGPCIAHVDRFLESIVEDNFSNADELEILQDNFEDVKEFT